jgi:hypothetical protein
MMHPDHTSSCDRHIVQPAASHSHPTDHPRLNSFSGHHVQHHALLLHVNHCGPIRTEAEARFDEFIGWAKSITDSGDDTGTGTGAAAGIGADAPYAVQLVRQRNFGPLESKRYFVPATGGAGDGFVEVTERDLVSANFAKIDSLVRSL